MAPKTKTWWKKKPTGMINSLLLSFTSMKYTKAEYFILSRSENSFREVWTLNWLSLFHSLHIFKYIILELFCITRRKHVDKSRERGEIYAEICWFRDARNALNSLLKTTTFKHLFCLGKRWIHACTPQVCANSGVNTWPLEPSTQANFRCLSQIYINNNR